MTIFKAYDVRGRYPDEIDEEIAYKIGRAYVELFNPKVVVIGRDMRLSSNALFSALSKGIVDGGSTVMNIGVVSTPMFYFAVNKLNADGGIMITASHNPKEYNGFKFVKDKAIPISFDTGIAEIEKRVKKNNFVSEKGKGKIVEVDLLDSYVDYVLSFADNFRRLKIVVDCSNGMAGLTVKKVLSKLDLDVVYLYDTLDGSFPNHEANPLKKENTIDLQEAVRLFGADAGFSFDGDADRLLLVDENGDRVRGDITTALIASVILKGRKEKVLYDLRSTKALPELIKELGGEPIISRVGHSYIKAKMREESIAFGGELSGHYYFRDNFYTDSGIIALLYLLTYISRVDSVSKEVKRLNKYFQSGEINIDVEDKDAALKLVEEHFSDGKISHIDGLTVEYPSWWFNLRKSNTEPLLRLNLEADNKDLLEKKIKEVVSVLREQ